VGGGAAAAAAALTPGLLLGLLEACVPPLLWVDTRQVPGVHRFISENPIFADVSVKGLVALANVLEGLCGAGDDSPGCVALAARPGLRRDVTHLLACRLRRAAPLRRLDSADYLAGVGNGVALVSRAAWAGGVAPAWAPWTVAQGAAAVLSLGAQPAAGSDRAAHADLLWFAAGAVLDGVAASIRLLAPARQAPPTDLRLPRPVVAALAQAVAAVMLAADARLPAPRFKGAAAAALAAAPAAAPPWEEGGAPAAPTQFTTAAESFAAFEMTARLLAVLPEVADALPPAPHIQAPEGGCTLRLAAQLWNVVVYGCQVCGVLRLVSTETAPRAPPPPPTCWRRRPSWRAPRRGPDGRCPAPGARPRSRCLTR
jgi:hypothetical protein